jgi:ABC-2 type transport system ATP-binding protein
MAHYRDYLVQEMRSMIEVTNLSKRFGATVAVRDISFTAQNGHVTGPLGENGAGKTTTLSVICGLLRADGGCVRVGSDATPIERRGVLAHYSTTRVFTTG